MKLIELLDTIAYNQPVEIADNQNTIYKTYDNPRLVNPIYNNREVEMTIATIQEASLPDINTTYQQLIITIFLLPINTN